MKVALVTGGASGIGLAIARKFNQLGYRVIIADIDDSVVNDLDSGLEFVAADLSDPEACRQLIATCQQRWGTIDVLINNAGFQHICPIEDFPLDAWQKMQAVMVTAPFLLTQNVWSGMKAKGWGRIINIASIHGKVASLYKSSYITAKHGLLGLTKASALEGGEYGITVNSICPGYVRTPLVEKQIADQARLLNLSEERVITEVMLKNAAIKRLLTPEEIADMAAYLCSESAACVTGSAWTIDQGWTAQ